MSIQLPAGLVSGMPCNTWSPARTNTYFELRQMFKYAIAQTWKKKKHLNIQVYKYIYMQNRLLLGHINMAWERVFLVSGL